MPDAPTLHRFIPLLEGAVLEAIPRSPGIDDLVSRIAAPLWSRVGRRIDSDLLWARPLLGDNGPEVLIQALDGLSALDPENRVLKAQRLARLLSTLLGNSDSVPSLPNAPAELVWTLPSSHPASTIRGKSYLERILGLINETSTSHPRFALH